MKKVFLMVSVLLVMVLMLLAFGCGPAAPAAKQAIQPTATTATKAAVIKWRGQTMNATTSAPYGPFQISGGHAETVNFTQWLERATNGRLTIDWSPGGSIFPDGEADLAVAKGLVDISFSYPAYFVGRIPEGDIQSAPSLVYQNIQEQWDVLMNRGMLPILREVYAAKGLYMIPNIGNGLSMLATNFPAPNIDSVKGKKIRGTGTRLTYVNLLGGSGVTAPMGDMYMGLKLGTFDGWISGVGSLESLKLKEVTTSVVVNPNIDFGAAAYLINKASFDALPDDIKFMLEVNAPYATYAAGQTWMNQSTWVLQKAADYGVKLYSWSQADIDKITKLVVEKEFPELAARSPASAKLMNIITQFMKDYGRIK